MNRIVIRPGSFNEVLIPLLSCPCCGQSSFTYVDSKFLCCTNASCSKNNEPFEIVKSQPLLIDFSKGLFDKKNYLNNAGGEVVARKKSSISKLIKRILWGDSPVSKTQVSNIISQVNADNKPVNVLIVGGGTIGLGTEALYTHPLISVISFDVYISDNTNFVADAHTIPIKNNCIDAIVVQAVLEHVLDPQKVVSEIYRVLKQGGWIYAETPFMQQVHEAAYDFTRFTESGHRWLFKDFELIDSGPVRGVGVSLLWSLRYFFAGLFRSKAVGSLAAALFFWLRFIEKIIPRQANIDGGSCFYFLGKKSTSQLKQTEIIQFYGRR